jgi:hypothetical protein
MRVLTFKLGTLLLFVTNCAYSASCTFMGISVGDKITQKEVMKQLGVKKYKFDTHGAQLSQLIQSANPKLDRTGDIELAKWKYGAYCTENLCNVPFGIKIGNEIEASAEVLIEAGEVTDIRVQFNNKDWNRFTKNLIVEYGNSWNIWNEPNFAITDEISNRKVVVDRTFYKYSNPNAQCQMSATNFDSMFLHRDPLGPYKGIFDILLTK